jgi:NAD dependent epimerase/dehydratase family enzyme
MTGRRIVIAGASGFVGRYLSDRFSESGDTVSTIGRSGADATWGDSAAIQGLIDGSDILINLACKSVNCRYTRKNKAAIFSSRLLTTAELGEAVQAVAHPPAVWFNASTATIYRHADDHPMTDEAGELGSGFSVNVATAWEREFFAHPRSGVRQVALRMAIVLGDGSAARPMVLANGSVGCTSRMFIARSSSSFRTPRSQTRSTSVLRIRSTIANSWRRFVG